MSETESEQQSAEKDARCWRSECRTGCYYPDVCSERPRAENDAATLSRLLFEAREQIEMWSDVVESQTGKPANYTRDLVERIDLYRAARGWNPDGFGGESVIPPEAIGNPEAAENALAEDLSWTSGEMTRWSETAHADHNRWSWRGEGHGDALREHFREQAQALIDLGWTRPIPPAEDYGHTPGCRDWMDSAPGRPCVCHVAKDVPDDY